MHRYEAGQRSTFVKHLIVVIASSVMLTFAVSANAADLLDPTPISERSPAVDGYNFKFGVLGGAVDRNVLGTASSVMFVGSVSAPLSFIDDSFGIQIDAAIGKYDSEFTSAAGGLHVFWRDPSVGLIGAYGDWAYLNPEHAGRVGAEFAIYDGRWSLDVMAGLAIGQHVETNFVDEVDLSFYFDDNTRGSIGHRWISRGHVANVSFEHMISEGQYSGWSIFGEAEIGEDDYAAGWGGIRYSFGTGSWSTLIERDRTGDPIVRIPRNLSSISQCGELDTPIQSNGWRADISTLCSDEDRINELSSTGIAKK